MYDAARIRERSRDRIRGVNAEASGAMNRVSAGASARCVEGSDYAAGSAEKAVTHSACVLVPTRDIARRIDAARIGSLSPRHVDRRGDRAIGSAHEAMMHKTRVSINPRDRPRRVDADDSRSQMAAGVCARNIDGRENALGSTNEAVVSIARIGEVSRDRACRVNA